MWVLEAVVIWLFRSVPQNTNNPGFSLELNVYEPRHEKTSKVTMLPAKTQISLGIHSVWSESSLCAQWVAKDPSFLHAESEASDQTGRMPRLICVFAGRTTTLLVLSWGGSYIDWLFSLIVRKCSELVPWIPLFIFYGFLYFLFFAITFCYCSYKMSRLVTKPIKWLCSQRRHRSAWASAQSDQSLRCAPDG